jgi:hypothetical protein
MMQDFPQALYINDVDPTNAVIFDSEWLIRSLDERGLRVRASTVPQVRGYQWITEIERGHGSQELPADDSPFGRAPPPIGRADPSRVGLTSGPNEPT